MSKGTEYLLASSTRRSPISALDVPKACTIGGLILLGLTFLDWNSWPPGNEMIGKSDCIIASTGSAPCSNMGLAHVVKGGILRSMFSVMPIAFKECAVGHEQPNDCPSMHPLKRRFSRTPGIGRVFACFNEVDAR